MRRIMKRYLLVTYPFGITTGSVLLLRNKVRQCVIDEMKTRNYKLEETDSIPPNVRQSFTDSCWYYTNKELTVMA